MTDALAVAVREAPVAGEVPRFELREWRERYGVVAGVTGRGNGGGPGFDLGLWTTQPVGEVMHRWRAFREAEAGFHATVLGNQVHRADLAWHDHAAGWVHVDGVDGHGTATPGLLLTVTLADCVPVYLVAPRQRAVALLHAGWRGTAAGIVSNGVELLHARIGATPADIIMHAGVGICGDCYEVGSEVVRGVGLTADGPGPWHVDLRERLSAEAAVLGLAACTTSAWCSAHDTGRFYSHRASGGRDGRMVAYLGFAAA
ncbi:MAG: polyphenol oxidase family protein [Gemmatimonadales bacterium]|nr:polyphenol oxidase family protein [Gemmatimonadales bacterium]